MLQSTLSRPNHQWICVFIDFTLAWWKRVSQTLERASFDLAGRARRQRPTTRIELLALCAVMPESSAWITSREGSAFYMLARHLQMIVRLDLFNPDASPDFLLRRIKWLMDHRGDVEDWIGNVVIDAKPQIDAVGL